MRHKFLLTCAVAALLAPAAARAGGETSSDYRMEAALQALFAVGARYHYGGKSPDTGFDCSGLVSHVYQRAWGIVLPRSTEEQHRVGHAVHGRGLRVDDHHARAVLLRQRHHAGDRVDRQRRADGEHQIAAARRLWPLMTLGGVVLLDDYGGGPAYRLQKEAFDALAKELGFHILALPTGQGLIIKSQ